MSRPFEFFFEKTTSKKLNLRCSVPGVVKSKRHRFGQPIIAEKSTLPIIHFELCPSATMPLEQLNFITGNKNKLAEVKAILGDVVPLQNQSLDLTEIQGTIEDVSKDKCRRAAAIVGFPILLMGYFST